jgi:hypothetical protein
VSISRYNELRDLILARLSEADASAKTCVAVLPDGFGQYNFDKDDNPVIHIATDVKNSFLQYTGTSRPDTRLCSPLFRSASAPGRGCFQLSAAASLALRLSVIAKGGQIAARAGAGSS